MVPSPASLSQILADLAHMLRAPVRDDSGRSTLDLVGQLQAALRWLDTQDGPDIAPLRDLVVGLLNQLPQDRLASRIALQQVQFRLQLYRELHNPTGEGRLSGEAHALNMLLARLLPDMPANLRKTAFSAKEYLALNPDVAAAGIDPFEHYVSGGAQEGRAPRRLTTDPTGAKDGTQIDPLKALARSDMAPCFSLDLPHGLRDAALLRLGKAQPAISVILPCWNRAHTVVTAVTSALLQSYTPQEVIVVDDGSSDASVSLLRDRFAEHLSDGRLVLIEQDNAGVSAARNAGLSRAKGEVIAYLDSDNQWDSDHLLFAVGGLLSVPGAESAYTALCRHNLSAGWSDVLFQRHDPATLAEENYIDLNSYVHQRSLYDRLGGFDTALTRLVDWDLILRYTANSPPVGLPVITGHHVIDSTALDNISTREDIAPNLARIRSKMADGHGTGP